VDYNSEMISKVKVKYNTYDKEFYILVKALKQWHRYIFSKEAIFNIDHHPLIFINLHSQMHEQSHLKWEAYIQHFPLSSSTKNGSLRSSRTC